MSKEDFDKFSPLWEKALDPIKDEKVIKFPKGKIEFKDHPKWPGAPSARKKIPIGPLESMFAMYHWYLFLGRHLLPQEILELANNVFPGMRIKAVSFFDKIGKPADSCAVVLESLDDENGHRLKGRCDRWFKDYLRTNAQASARAKHLLGFRGRLDNLLEELPMIGGRKLEYWEACIHYGVLYMSANHGSVLLHHYNAVGPQQNSVTKFSGRLKNADDSITKKLIIPYKKHEQFWVDKAQDVILEHEAEAYERGPGRYKGQSLEVPFELRTLLGLKHSHITLNSSDSDPLTNIFNQSQYLQGSQSSYSGQSIDPRYERQHLTLPPINPNNLPPILRGPATVPAFAGSSTQASAAGSDPLNDSYAQSPYRQGTQYFSPGQSLDPRYQQQYQTPSLGDRMSAATTGMGNLSVAASAPAPGQDQGRKKGKEQEQRPKKHGRSETPPEEKRPKQRQKGKDARKNLPFLPSEQEK